MSLEDKIEALTKAVEANTAAVEKQNETVAKALGGSAAKSTGTAAKSTTAKKTTTRKSTAKPKALTGEDIRGLYGPYLAGASDKATKKRLIETTKPLLEHFGVDKITEVDEDQRKEAMEFGKMLVDAFEEGGIEAAEAVEFPFMEDADDDGDDGDDGDDDDDDDDDGVCGRRTGRPDDADPSTCRCTSFQE